MLTQLQDALNHYLVPLMLGVPVAIVLYLLATRKRPEPPPVDEASRKFLETVSLELPAEPTELTRPQAMPSLRQAAAERRAAPTAPPGPLPPPSARDDDEPHPWAATTQAPLLPESPDSPPDTLPFEPAYLLLVDDSATARAKLRKLFEGAGYATELARDGLEALDKLRQRRFNLMITDLEMPNMDGIELITTVSSHAQHQHMPVIAITGHEDLQAKVHQCQGLYGIFKKPWNDEALLRRVSTLVDIGQKASARRR